MSKECEMYKTGMSIPEVHEETGVALSTLRYRFKRAGILRSRADGVRNAISKGRPLGPGNTRPKTEETKGRMSKAKLRAAEKTALGFRFTPSGYMEFTRGPHKGRLLHTVIMEKKLGRQLKKDEIVHHKDGKRDNNHPSNLEVMTRSRHARGHRMMDHKQKIRNERGQFV